MSVSTDTANKQYLAKILFTREQLEQKVVAKRVGVSEKTMSKWVNEFNWKSLRRRLLITREEQLNSFYEQLENLNNEIKAKNNGKGVPDTKQADIQIKLTAAIKNLETDLAIADLVESGQRFIKHIQKTGAFDDVMKATDQWHEFIMASMKK